MIYFGNPCGSSAVLGAMSRGKLGFIATPAQSNPRPAGVRWCADNGCFSDRYRGDWEFTVWLAGQRGIDDCEFAVAPDVVGDAERTLARSRPLLTVIRGMGYRVALVAQDGLEQLRIPWDRFDALFIGGSTEWKLGAGARAIAREASLRCKWVHMGRVNSRERLRYAATIGCDSADGTLLTFGPDLHIGRLLGWLKELNGQTDFLVDECPTTSALFAPRCA